MKVMLASEDELENVSLLVYFSESFCGNDIISHARLRATTSEAIWTSIFLYGKVSGLLTG